MAVSKCHSSLFTKIKSKERGEKKINKTDGEPNDQTSLLRGHWGYGLLSDVPSFHTSQAA